ncbi:hypothetical protein HZR84_05695 [Hyphobacterium sp. CCMP332]|nr:hypothetical protein HZR84_05695 [Hyphobacterium sp. CCMP332]
MKLKLNKNIAIFSSLILLSGCAWGRYPCPDPVKEKNSEKDGTGITLIEVKRDKKGILKKKQPKRIKRK